MTHFAWRVFALLSIVLSHYLSAADTKLDTVSANHYPLSQKLIVDGVIEAVKQATMSAQTSGQVLEVNFDVDDFVKKGDVLVRFKNIQQQASLGQSEAQLAEAQAMVKAAQKEFNRIQELYTKQAISAAQLDKAKADLEVAQARLESTKASITQSTEQVEYTVVRAPYSGVVLERRIEPGEIASPGSPIMTGFSLDTLRVIATVPQVNITAIRKHLTAQVILNDDQRFDSNKLTIGNVADPKTHTFKVRIDLPPNTPNVYPGMLVKVAFLVGQEKRLMIPASAVAYRGEVRAIYIVDDKNKVTMRHVRLGDTDKQMVEVLAGLEAGEKVAINPVNAAIVLKEQQKITLSPVAAPAH